MMKDDRFYVRLHIVVVIWAPVLLLAAVVLGAATENRYKWYKSPKSSMVRMYGPMEAAPVCEIGFEFQAPMIDGHTSIVSIREESDQSVTVCFK